MLDFCLLHYLLSSDNEAMVLYKCHHSMHYFTKLLTKKLSSTSKFGSLVQILPSDIGEYLSWFFNAVVVVFYSVFILFFYKRYSSCKIWKKSIDNVSFVTFFTALDLIEPKFCPKSTPLFFCLFPMKYVSKFN